MVLKKHPKEPTFLHNTTKIKIKSFYSTENQHGYLSHNSLFKMASNKKFVLGYVLVKSTAHILQFI